MNNEKLIKLACQSRLERIDKEMLLDQIANTLVQLDDDSDRVFLMERFNTVYVGGIEYKLKMVKTDNN
jgi:hypothetical protein